MCTIHTLPVCVICLFVCFFLFFPFFFLSIYKSDFHFHFHYGSNLTSSGIQVRSMQNVNCALKIVGKYYIRCVLYAKMHFTNCPCSSSSPSGMRYSTFHHCFHDNWLQYSMCSASESCLHSFLCNPYIPFHNS